MPPSASHASIISIDVGLTYSFLVPRTNPAFGHMQAQDSLVTDGLFDVYNKFAMGNCAEHTAKKHNITREEQDDHCLSSYTRAEEAWGQGLFADEIAPVTVKGRKGDTVIKEDEEYKKLIKDKYRSLRPVFVKDGTVTAANASTLNDGASAVVLASGSVVEKEGLKPLAKILGECLCTPSSCRYGRRHDLKPRPDLIRLRRCRMRPDRLPHRPNPRRPRCTRECRCEEGGHCAVGVQRGLFSRRYWCRKDPRTGQEHRQHPRRRRCTGSRESTI